MCGQAWGQCKLCAGRGSPAGAVAGVHERLWRGQAGRGAVCGWGCDAVWDCGGAFVRKM